MANKQTNKKRHEYNREKNKTWDLLSKEHPKTQKKRSLFDYIQFDFETGEISFDENDDINSARVYKLMAEYYKNIL